MKLTLELHYDAALRRPIAAWWLPGNDVDAWLRSARALEAALADARWLLLPGDEHGSLRGAVLTLPAGNASTKTAPHVDAVPLGRMGRRLFLPTNARLAPYVREEEVDRQLPDDESVFVWLPVEGLIRCDSANVISTDRLIDVPTVDRDAWTAAAPGETLARRLVALEPVSTPEIGRMFDTIAHEIDGDGAAWHKLPSIPGEAARKPWLSTLVHVGVLVILLIWWSSLARQPNTALGQALIGLLFLACLINLARLWRRQAGARGEVQPTTDGRPHRAPGVLTWMSEWSQWFTDRQHRRRLALEEQRERELARLLHMLENQPDAGLRFALPLAGESWHRGLAAPSARLTPRPLDFSPGLPRYSGAADVWSISESMRRQLAARYRALAEREIALNRHRRAAYIYAELLGDLRSAAQVLADGGHFREAAALYEQRLADRRAAAFCLEKGGLWNEALAKYAAQGDFEKVGELYVKLQFPELAEKAFRRAVEERFEAHDYLTASRLLEQRLQQPQEALQTLLLGWPHSAQASRCLEAAFDLLARRADHPQATRCIRQLASDVPLGSIAKLSTALARVATHYPEQAVRHLAADQTRVVAALGLATSDTTGRHELLDALQRLAPTDRVLQQDCERSRRKSPPASKNKTSTGTIFFEHESHLPDAHWQTAVGYGSEIFFAGWREKDVVIARRARDGAFDVATGRLRGGVSGGPILLAIPPRDGAALLVHPLGSRGLDIVRDFANSDVLRRDTGTPLAPIDATCVAVDASNVHSVSQLCRTERGLRVLRHRITGGQLVKTLEIEGWPHAAAAVSPNNAVSFLDLLSTIYVASPQGLDRWTNFAEDGGSQVLYSSITTAPVLRLVRDSFQSKMIAVSFAEGGRLWWGDPAVAAESSFGAGIPAPCVAFMNRSMMIVAGATMIEAYSIAESQLRMYGRVRMPRPRSEVIAVVPLGNSRHFVVVTAHGALRQFSLP